MTDEYIFPIINIFASVLIFPNPLFAEGKKISWELAVMVFRGYKAGINDAPMTPFTAYMNIWKSPIAEGGLEVPLKLAFQHSDLETLNKMQVLIDEQLQKSKAIDDPADSETEYHPDGPIEQQASTSNSMVLDNAEIIAAPKLIQSRLIPLSLIETTQVY